MLIAGWKSLQSEEASCIADVSNILMKPLEHNSPHQQWK
jgi:hypothetical protein